MARKRVAKQPKSGQKRLATKGSFKPGQSGNPKGRPPLGLSAAEKFRAIGEEVVDAERGWTRLDLVIRRLYADAAGGKHGAAAILLDRGWGKPDQPISISQDEPLLIRLDQ